MAENIGKIVVSIEAEVAELRKGLAQAEAEFKKSADKMVKEQQKFSNKFKKSWVELQAKISVVTTALGIAEGVLRGITGAMEAFGEKGASSAEKVGGAIVAFGDAGIPVISQIIGVAEGLAEVFVQSSSKIKQVQKDLADFNAGIERIRKKRTAQGQADDLSRTVANMATRYKIMEMGMEDEVDMEFQLQLKRYNERINLERNLQKQIMAMGQLGKPAEQMMAEKKNALAIFDMETELLERQLQNEAQKKQEARKKDIDDAIEADRKKNEAIEKQTQTLQTKLNIMLAKQAGDEEKARTLAIEARYDKMLEGASGVNRELIQQMKAIEMASVGGDSTAGATTGGGGGVTSSVSTALGSFTVAQRGDPVQKEHTKLLKSISESSALVASKLNKPSAQGIVIAS